MEPLLAGVYCLYWNATMCSLPIFEEHVLSIRRVGSLTALHHDAIIASGERSSQQQLKRENPDMHYRKLLFCCALVFLGLLASTAAVSVDAAGPGFPALTCPERDEPSRNSCWQHNVMVGSNAAVWGHDMPEQFLLSSSGGPDDFGYTWDDSVALNWIDASGGTDTGISSGTDHVGPIEVGFSFKYYENAYTQLYISRFGFVAFNDNSFYRSWSEIPSPGKPNDVIAPHWVPAYTVNGYVRYLGGGKAPDRWFVVEWNRLESDWDAAEEYTFEVVLHENGDIVFQYGTMTVDGNWYCQSSGIEDSMGLDGLSVTDFCDQIAPNHAVRIYRPAPSARVNVYPLYQGHFTHRGEAVSFQVPIQNTGELGSDTYDLFVSSSWFVGLYAADGITPLTDTDSDGTVDTGPVAQGGSKTIVAKVIPPGMVSIGDSNSTTLPIRSSLNTNKSKICTLQTAIPAPFCQVYLDSTDGAMLLDVVGMDSETIVKASPDGHYGYDWAVTDTPLGYAYCWSKYRSGDAVSTYEIEYALLNEHGEIVRGLTRLTDNSDAAVNTYDWFPAIAAAPNGRIGIVWYRRLYDSSNGNSNYNIFYAILSTRGDVVVPPTNLTNNPFWGGWWEINIPRFGEPEIAATTDNRFVLSWDEDLNTTDGQITDVYYAIVHTDGTLVVAPTKFTNDTPGDDMRYDDPNLTAMSKGRVLLTWGCHSEPTELSDICNAVLDSAGNCVSGPTNVSNTSAYSFSVDAAVLPCGNSIIAWSEYYEGRYQIAYTILDASQNTILPSPVVLSNLASDFDEYYVSVAAQGADHAVLTWGDGGGHNLYYALVDASGDILTPPMIFQQSQSDDGYIATSYNGYGNTSYVPSLIAWADLPLILLPRESLPPTQELFYDDGTPESSLMNGAGQLAAVRFTVGSPSQVVRLQYYIKGDMRQVRVSVYDGSWSQVYSETVQPSVADPQGGGWFEWDITSQGVTVDGDFYVALEWLEDGPQLGVDDDPPDHGRSYAGHLPPERIPSGNAMIRVTVW